MKYLALLLPAALSVSCVSSSRPDSRVLSRTYLSAYVNNVHKPPIHAFYNGHPAGEIRVTYEITRPGSQPTRYTSLVKPYENLTVAPASAGDLKIIATDFTDPFYISHDPLYLAR